MPWPPPTHMVSRPMVLSWNWRLLMRVVAIRAPVIPNGWPTAIAPPFTLSRDGSMPSSRDDGMTCAANASLISTRSTSSIDIPARPSACLTASMGPRPMISGESPLTPVATIRASGVRPSSAALVSLITTSAAAPSLSGQQFPAVTVPCSRNTGLRAEIFSSVVPRPGAATGRHDGAVRQRHRHDLALPEPVGEGLLGQVLGPDAEFVLLQPGDPACRGDVLRGLPHRDVDVVELAGRARGVPRRLGLGGRLGPGLRGVKGRVLRVGQRVAASLGEPGDALDPAGDEHVALAGLDRVVGHPGGLQRGRAVAVDGGTWHGVEAEQHGGHPGDVEPLLATG